MSVLKETPKSCSEKIHILRERSRVCKASGRDRARGHWGRLNISAWVRSQQAACTSLGWEHCWLAAGRDLLRGLVVGASLYGCFQWTQTLFHHCVSFPSHIHLLRHFFVLYPCALAHRNRGVFLPSLTERITRRRFFHSFLISKTRTHYIARRKGCSKDWA